MVKETNMSNARRFITAYNTIDHELRIRHNFRRSLSFSDMIRKAVVVNYTVRKYEDKLIDYGRLRNAIIHKSNDEFVIAEPHTEVVDEFEKISSLISAPPKVWNTVCTKDVLTVQYDTKLNDVIKLIYESTYSNLPVFKDGEIIGVANGQKLLDYLGKCIADKKEITSVLEKTTIEDAIKDYANFKYYEIADMDITIEEVLSIFFKNRKLVIIIITKNGTMSEAPIGILTPTDIMELNSYIDIT